MRFLFLALLVLVGCGKVESDTGMKSNASVPFLTTSTDDGSPTSRIINGTELAVDKWKEVINLTIGTGGCSGTVVGPKVVLTAAHCGVEGAAVTTTINGKSMTGKITRSTLYPAKDHDIGLVILDTEVTKADVGQFGTISGAAVLTKQVYLVGYGCTASGGGAIDGKLRGGFSTAQSFADFDVVSTATNGAAVCFGDSGGPTLLSDDSTAPMIVGINSKGNIKDTTYSLRTDIPESQQFFADVIKKLNVVICGINSTAVCTGIGPTPTAPGPFSITAPAAQTNSTPVVAWSAAKDAVSYDVAVSVKSDCSSPIQSYSISSTAQQLTTLADGPYFVCVVAKNTVGNTAATNNGYGFTVKTGIPPVPNGQYPSGFVYETAKSLSKTMCDRSRGLMNTINAAYSDDITLVNTIQNSVSYACSVLDTLNASLEFDTSYRNLRILSASIWPSFSSEVDRVSTSLDATVINSRNNETATIASLMKVYEPNGQPVLNRCVAQLISGNNPSFTYEGANYVGYIGFGESKAVAATQALATCGQFGECQISQCWVAK